MLALLALMQTVLPYRPSWTIIYADYIFVPFQSIRNTLFGWSQLSFGDLMYFTMGAYLLWLVGKWIYYLVTVKQNHTKLGNSLLNFVIFFATVYLVFLIGWGGNYYKPTLADYWRMDKSKWETDTTDIVYDKFLTDKLNIYVAGYQTLKFKEARKDAMAYYKEHTDCKARLHGLNIKPSIYGYLMQHLGIQGYYNPITGEAQVNRYLPDFMLPFVMVHEMAHQAGIAAEDDANLLAYSISIQSGNPTFRYSAYLNMWLYNHYRIEKRAPELAEQLMANLNPITLEHLEVLRKIREEYRSEFSAYSSGLYDFYLRMLQQEEGIGSYSKSVITTYAWEQSRDSIRHRKLYIP